MNRKSLIVLIFAVTLVIAPAARAQILSPDSGGGGLAYKANSRPAGMSQAEYRALMLRGAALNARYGNPLTDMSPQQFRAAYLAGIAYANGVSSSDVQPTDSSGPWADSSLPEPHDAGAVTYEPFEQPTVNGPNPPGAAGDAYRRKPVTLSNR